MIRISLGDVVDCGSGDKIMRNNLLERLEFVE